MACLQRSVKDVPGNTAVSWLAQCFRLEGGDSRVWTGFDGGLLNSPLMSLSSMERVIVVVVEEEEKGASEVGS